MIWTLILGVSAMLAYLISAYLNKKSSISLYHLFVNLFGAGAIVQSISSINLVFSEVCDLTHEAQLCLIFGAIGSIIIASKAIYTTHVMTE